MKVLQEWVCDVCGKIINEPEDGYIIWKSNDDKFYDFRIIHQGICDNREYTQSAPLTDHLGADGLIVLTAFLSAGELKVRSGSGNCCEVTNFDEFVDLFRRLQVPYYEEARIKFSNTEVIRRLDDMTEVGPYTEEYLKKIIEKF